MKEAFFVTRIVITGTEGAEAREYFGPSGKWVFTIKEAEAFDDYQSAVIAIGSKNNCQIDKIFNPERPE